MLFYEVDVDAAKKLQQILLRLMVIQ